MLLSCLYMMLIDIDQRLRWCWSASAGTWLIRGVAGCPKDLLVVQHHYVGLLDHCHGVVIPLSPGLVFCRAAVILQPPVSKMYKSKMLKKGQYELDTV